MNNSGYVCERLKRDGYLLVRNDGVIDSYDVMSDRVAKSVASLMENKIQRLLIDDRKLILDLDPYDIMRIGEDHEKRSFHQQGVRIACLHHPDCRKQYEMLETVHLNRSINFRLFESEEAALAWLRG